MKIIWDLKTNQLQLVASNGDIISYTVTAGNYKEYLRQIEERSKTDPISNDSLSLVDLKKSFVNHFSFGLEEMPTDRAETKKRPQRRHQHNLSEERKTAVLRPEKNENTTQKQKSSGKTVELEPKPKPEIKWPEGSKPVSPIPKRKKAKSNTLDNRTRQEKIQLIKLREQLIDEMERLKGSRTNTNLFMESSEKKLRVMRDLLQLITAPTEEQKEQYFSRGETMTFGQLMADFYLYQVGVDSSINNWTLLNKPRLTTNRDTEPTDTIRTSSLEFLKKLELENANLPISKNPPVLEKRSPKKIPIRSVVIVGDSLSDIGQMAASNLGSWSGINKYNSSEGSFSNAFIWLDNFLNMFADKTFRRAMEAKDYANDDISDCMLTKQGSKFDLAFRKLFNLEDNKEFRIQNHLLARIYAVGGLTSHSYFGQLSEKVALTFARLFVSTLGGQREKLFKDDEKARRTNAEKQETLVIEWSGANDLITVNSSPSIQAADDGLKDRFNNANALISKGYKNIVLFNLPNLAKTPRYLAKSEEERKNADDVVHYYNGQLQVMGAELKEMHPDANIEVFDVSSLFDGILEQPQAFQFSTHYGTAEVIRKDHGDIRKLNSLEKNVLYFQLSKYKNHIKYRVIDPAGQTRTEVINNNPTIPPEEQIQEDARQKGHILVSDEYQKDHPDTTFDTILTPFKETKAFKRFEEEAIAKGVPVHVLATLNLIFYDDVHPTSDTHIAIFELFRTRFFDKYFEFIPPEIDLDVQNKRHKAKEAEDVELHDKVDREEEILLSHEKEEDRSLEKLDDSEIQQKTDEFVCSFVELYLKKWRSDRLSFFGFTEKMAFKNLENADLVDILKQAKHEKRSRNILINEGWISKMGVISNKISELLVDTELEGVQNLAGIKDVERFEY